MKFIVHLSKTSYVYFFCSILPKTQCNNWPLLKDRTFYISKGNLKATEKYENITLACIEKSLILICLINLLLSR